MATWNEIKNKVYEWFGVRFVPPGGNTNQVIGKVSPTNFDIGWVDQEINIKGEYANNTDAVNGGLVDGDVYYNPVSNDNYNLAVVQVPDPIPLLDVDNPSEIGFDYSTS